MPTPSSTLVVIFLRGAADGLSLVPPIGDDAYHRARPTLRVRPEETLTIPGDGDGYFALNGELALLRPHLAEGRLAIVHGAGSQDTTRSHFEAQDYMEHGGQLGGGWLARYLRASRPSASALAAVAVGATQPESLRGSPVGAVMQTIRDFAVGADNPVLLAQLERLYSDLPGALGLAGRSTLEAIERLRAMREHDLRAEGGANYPATSFGRGLREIAKLVKADLGMNVATVDMVGGGLGWDTHFVQGQAFPALARELAEGVDAFWRDLGSHRAHTTVVVMTEFGRRVRENTSLGTDHGLGGVMMVLGENLPRSGPIVPGGIHSGWRSLSDESLIGPGDVPVTTDYRAVLRPLLAQMSPEVDLDRVFPM